MQGINPYGPGGASHQKKNSNHCGRCDGMHSPQNHSKCLRIRTEIARALPPHMLSWEAYLADRLSHFSEPSRSEIQVEPNWTMLREFWAEQYTAETKMFAERKPIKDLRMRVTEMTYVPDSWRKNSRDLLLGKVVEISGNLIRVRDQKTREIEHEAPFIGRIEG